MFLQLCEEAEVNRISVIISAKENKGHRFLSKFKIQKDCGPTLRGFGVQGFVSTKAKHQHTQKLPKL